MPAGKPILVLNGPNLNMLGVREPETYGAATLQDAESQCAKIATDLGVTAEWRQSNDEGTLIDWIQAARKHNAAIIVNAGGYSHTSVALRDALTLSELPVIEVHVTNIHARENFRHHSMISGVARAVICGCGIDGYAYAMQTAAKLIKKE